MPIEVKELVIKATVSEQEGKASGKQGALSEAAKEEIIQACIDQMLRILKQQRER